MLLISDAGPVIIVGLRVRNGANSSEHNSFMKVEKKGSERKKREDKRQLSSRPWRFNWIMTSHRGKKRRHV